jgi:hypothetical protein
MHGDTHLSSSLWEELAMGLWDTAIGQGTGGHQWWRWSCGWLGALGLVITVICGSTAAGAQPAVPSENSPFANPNLVVSVHWLMQHSQDPNVRIVDSRPRAEYDKGHIPGAVSLPVADTFDPAQHKNYPDTKEKLESLFASRGMSNTTTPRASCGCPASLLVITS